MKPISDRTLAELLEARLGELQLFQLMARKLGPDPHPVFLSAHGFDAAGEVYRVSGEASTLDQALLELFEAARIAKRNTQRATPRPTDPRPPRVFNQCADRIGSVRHFSRETPKPSEPIDTRAHRLALALAIAERVGAVTATSLMESLGLADSAEACEALLGELASAGKLRRSKRFGFVLPERGDPDA